MRWLLGLILCLMSSVALAQGCGSNNPLCVVPDRPTGDSSNAAANTRFVQAAAAAGTGNVTSVFSRLGAVVATVGDYTFSQISGTLSFVQMPSIPANSVYGSIGSGTMGLVVPSCAGALTYTAGTGFGCNAQNALTIAAGTVALGVGAIASATCAGAVTGTATVGNALNVLATDTLTASFNSDPTAVIGYIPTASGMLTIIPYPTGGAANFKVCNNTGSTITPGAITLNWRVTR